MSKVDLYLQYLTETKQQGQIIVIETENLKQGMYMIRVSDNISVKTQKIIVQH